MTPLLAAMAAALTTAQATAPPEAVQAVEVTAAARLKGDMTSGTIAYPPSFFTVVRPGTALDMINWLPGSAVEDTRDFRGLEGSTGNVLIDGKPPTSKTDTLLSVLRRIPAERVERVDLIVGGAPGVDMHGRNVIANVVLKPAPAPQITVSGQTYLDKRGRLSPQLTLTRSNKHDGTVSEASLELSRNIAIFPGYGYGPMRRLDGAGALVYAADAGVVVGGPSATGNLSYEFPLRGGRLRLSGTGRYYGTLADETYSLRPGPGAYSLRDDQAYRQGELGLRYERSLGRLTGEAQLLERISVFDSDQRTDRPPALAIFNVDSDLTESVARAVLRYKRDGTFTLETFAEGALNSYSTTSAGSLNGVVQLLPVDDIDITERRGETGATAAWKPDKAFSLDAALKLEASTLTAGGDVRLTRRFTYLKPRLAVSLALDKRTQLRLRAEHEVGQISFAQYITSSEYNTGAVRVGNPGLRPSRALVGEAALQRSFWTGGDLSLTVRAKRLRDVIDVAPAATLAGLLGVISNIGGGRETDAVVSLTLPLKPLGLAGGTLKGTLAVARVRVTDPTDGTRRPFSNTPQTFAELHYAQDLPALRLNLGFDAYLRGKTTLYRPFGNEFRGGWPHANLFVEYRPAPAWTLRAEVQNLPAKKVRITTTVYPGLRTLGPATYVDERLLTNGPLLLVRLRRTFG
jgi:hypothetical protein